MEKRVAERKEKRRRWNGIHVYLPSSVVGVGLKEKSCSNSFMIDGWERQSQPLPLNRSSRVYF